MTTITWVRRGTVHIGRIIGGTIGDERERAMRLRTYHIQRGEGYSRSDLQSKFYVHHQDPGMKAFVRTDPRAFDTLKAAKAWAETHLRTEIPRLRLKFIGRNARGELTWEDNTRITRWGRKITGSYAIPANEFYKGMVVR